MTAASDARQRELLEILESTAQRLSRQLGQRVPIEDLRGHGHEAFVEILRRFDDARSDTFRGYARLRLRGAILDGLRKDSGLPRSVADKLRALAAVDGYVEDKRDELSGAPAHDAAEADARLHQFFRGVATAYSMGLARSDTDDAPTDLAPQPDDPEVEYGRHQLRALLLRELDGLGDPEATILRRHYFHDDDLQDAAAHVGLSKSWGSRVHARGLEKLGARLAALKSEGAVTTV
ncbi:MAG: sigma-70 family RNA polymerase sigma factor [Polyangiales bacterium]